MVARPGMEKSVLNVQQDITLIKMVFAVRLNLNAKYLMLKLVYVRLVTKVIK